MFWSWCKVGAQSFGGGAATLALIRAEFVARRAWITEDQFTRDWALCRPAPGINLIALAYLFGKRLGGRLAMLLSLIGLLVPSFALTLLGTYFYALFSSLPGTRAALRMLLPAVAGIGLATSFQMGRPLLMRAWQNGKASAAFSIALLCAAGIACTLNVPVIAILLGAGALGAAKSAIPGERVEESV